jgi:hypothetical protein
MPPPPNNQAYTTRMNRNLLFFMGAMAYCCALTAPTAMAQDQPQADPQITALPTANAYQISWPGVAGRLYYLQFTTSLDGWTSNDPEIWTCAPAVFLGDGSTVTAGFSSTVPRSFVRLKYSLATHYTEGDHGDADGDGLSNIDEVSIHLTEPLLADTDNDGLSDSDEITRGTNPKIADTDNDGLSDSDEITGGTNPLQFNVPAITIEHAWREAVIYHFNLNCPDPHTRLYRTLATTAPPDPPTTRSLNPFDASSGSHLQTIDPYVAVSNAWAAANGVPAFTPNVQNWGGWVPYNPQAHKLEGILRRDYTGGYLSDTELPAEFTRLSITDNTLPTGTTAYNRSVYYGTDRDVRLKTAWPVPYPITRNFIRIDREGTAPASNLNNVTWTDTGYSTVTLTIPAGQTYSTPNPAGIWTADTRLLSRPDKLSANPSSQPFFTTARAERRFVLLPVEIEEVISDQIAGNDANKLPTAYFKYEANNPMLMATRSGQKAKLQVKMAGGADPKIYVGARKNGTQAVLGYAPVTAPVVELEFDVPANSHDAYEIVAGYDANSNSRLDDAEVMTTFKRTPLTDARGVAAPDPQNLLDRVIIVDQGQFSSSKSTVIGYNYPGSEYAGDLIVGFARGQATIPNATRVPLITISSTQPGLSHPVGARWNGSNQDTTYRFTFADGSPASNDTESSNALKQIVQKVINDNKAAMISAYTGTPEWPVSPYYNFTEEKDFIKTDGEPEILGAPLGIPELGASFGKVKITGQLRVSYKKTSATTIQVGSVQVIGSYEDLYDFAYGGGTRARQASMVQAGHATLAGTTEPNGGKVFFTRVEFNSGFANTWNGNY